MLEWDPMRPRHFGVRMPTPMKFLPIMLGCLGSTASLFCQSPAPGVDQQLQQAQQCMVRRDWACAISSYRQAITLNPRSDIAYLGLSAALLNKGSVDESAAALGQALPLLESRTTASGAETTRLSANRLNIANFLDNLAYAYYRLNRLDDAFKAEDMSVRVQPGLWGSWNTRGMILEAQGKLEDAIASYKTASGLSPRSVDITHNLSEALQRAGHFDDAIAVLQQALALNPRAAKLQTSLGNALYAKERFSESETAYQASLAQRSNDSATFYGLSLALRAQGKYAEAVKASLQAHELAPADSDATLGLAGLYSELGRYDEAASLM